MNASSTLRIALLGTGGMARKHGANLLRQGNVRIVGVCGRSEDSGRNAVAAIDKTVACDAPVFTEFSVMLDRTTPDAVVVCLPPGAHAGETELAAARGIALFLEKPITLSIERATAMVRAAEQSGALTHVGYHMRFAESVAHVKSLIDSGTAGLPTLFQASYLCNALHPDWWRTATLGGGQVVEQAIHLYDLAIHLLGKPTRVVGMASNLTHQNVPGYAIEDTAAGMIYFASGAIASIVSSNGAVPMQWNTPTRLVCEKLQVELPALSTAAITTHDGQPSENWWGRGAKPIVEQRQHSGDPYLRQAELFVAALRGDAAARSQLVPIEQGLLSLRVVLGVMESARNGSQPVAV
jgi:predicted dehydrogenase